MSRLLQEERGFTLTEVLVVSVIMIVVLGAVLGAFETFQRTSNSNQRLNDVQESVRVAVDSLTRELRNMASPVDALPDSIVRKEPHDLAFLSVAGQKPAGSLNTRNTRRVRYCLNTAGTLYRQQQTWTTAAAPGVPSMSSCPDNGWQTSSVLVSNSTNANGDRPVFTYNDTEPTRVTEVGVGLFVDTDPGRSPKEVALQSAVFLRNQNRIPVAEFDMQVSGNALVLNASQSSDPEGRAMSFYWYDEARTATTNLCTGLPAGIPAGGCVGTGLVFNYVPPGGGSRTIHMIASDGNLTAQAPSQSACVGVCP